MPARIFSCGCATSIASQPYPKVAAEQRREAKVACGASHTKGVPSESQAAEQRPKDRQIRNAWPVPSVAAPQLGLCAGPKTVRLAPHATFAARRRCATIACQCAEVREVAGSCGDLVWLRHPDCEQSEAPGLGLSLRQCHAVMRRIPPTFMSPT